MKKVSGSALFTVHVNCPDCKHRFDLIETDAENDYVVTHTVYQNTIEACTNMDIDITCPECECEFILDRVEY